MKPRTATCRLIGILLILSCTGCAISRAGLEASPIPPTLAATQTERTEPLPSPTPQPTSTFQRSPPPTPAVPLSEEGPWLLFMGALDTVSGEVLGAWAVNADGSGLTWLVDWPEDSENILATASTSNGGHFAYVFGTNYWEHLTLYIRSLPTNELDAVIPLTSPETEPAGPIDRETEQALEALLDFHSLAWSPDGQRLAFQSMMNGPSADLYVFSLEDGSVTQLTSGPSQSAYPSWSPDGRTIFQKGVNDFGTGAGANLAGFWAVQSDGSGLVALLPDYHGDLDVIGWRDNNTVVVHRVSMNGFSRVQACSARTGTAQMTWEGYFSEAAVDPISGALLVAVNEANAADSAYDYPDCDRCDEAGLYRIAPGEEPARLIDSPAWRVVWYADVRLFVATTTQGVVTVSPSGEITELASPPPDSYGDPGFPLPSPDGRYLAWDRGDSVWISSLQHPQESPRRISPERIWDMTWSPSGALFLTTFRVDVLYVAQAPGFVPQAMTFFPLVGHLGWVWR